MIFWLLFIISKHSRKTQSMLHKSFILFVIHRLWMKCPIILEIMSIKSLSQWLCTAHYATLFANPAGTQAQHSWKVAHCILFSQVFLDSYHYISHFIFCFSFFDRNSFDAHLQKCLNVHSFLVLIRLTVQRQKLLFYFCNYNFVLASCGSPVFFGLIPMRGVRHTY